MDLVLPSSKYIQSYNEYIEELGDEVRYFFLWILIIKI